MTVKLWGITLVMSGLVRRSSCTHLLKLSLNCAHSEEMKWLIAVPPPLHLRIAAPCGICPSGSTAGDYFVPFSFTITCGILIAEAGVFETGSGLCKIFGGYEIPCCLDASGASLLLDSLCRRKNIWAFRWQTVLLECSDTHKRGCLVSTFRNDTFLCCGPAHKEYQ